MVDRRVIRRIIGVSELSVEDFVVEVGPGNGILTRSLAEKTNKVVTIELDDRLADRLKHSLNGIGNVSVISSDARYVELETLIPSECKYKVVANLPYYAATPIIRRFLEANHKPILMVFMVQREVAQEMTATPGKMSILSVATQLYGKARIIDTVSAEAFRPKPKVTSSIVRIDVHSKPILDIHSVDRFFRLVRAGFSAPRKQIHNSLKLGLNSTSESINTILSNASIDPKRRPQTLSISEWGKLYDVTDYLYKSPRPNQVV